MTQTKYRLHKFEDGEVLFVTGHKHPIGFIKFNKEYKWWEAEYHDSDIGHSAIDTKEQAISMILEHVPL
jgi:hypothetical protein